MNKRVIIKVERLLIVMLIFFMVENITAQSSAQYYCPQPYSFSNDDYDHTIAPIGWSRDGNFAALVSSHDDMCGTRTEFIILNPKSDKVLKSITLCECEDCDFENSWQKKSDKIKYYLAKFKIKQNERFYNFRDMSDRSGKDFKVSYSIIRGWDDYMETESDMGFKIKVSTGYGSKIVGNYNWNIPFRGVDFLGAFKSPYEDLVLMVTGYGQLDAEGDPGRRIVLTGCSLASGFD